MDTSRNRPALSAVEIALIALFLGAGFLLLPALVNVTHHHSHKSDCKNNLKQLGNYLTLYVSRYGGDRDYPIDTAIGGSGAPVPSGSNGAFWSWLYRIPSQTTAVSQRPGDDSLFICKQTGTQPTTTALEYTGPRFDAVWPAGAGGSGSGSVGGAGPEPGSPIFPGGRLGAAVRGEAPIAGDLLGPPDRPNHGGSPGAPDDDWCALFFDGHVETIVPGSAKHTLYVTATTGVRTS
ncbi:MAG: hypothetical protein HY873_01180 [Chloroflexi bacterium]|nr:hypothetical protein [Chloroflexota bacterium]